MRSGFGPNSLGIKGNLLDYSSLSPLSVHNMRLFTIREHVYNVNVFEFFGRTLDNLKGFQ